jgi:hemoglobin
MRTPGTPTRRRRGFAHGVLLLLVCGLHACTPQRMLAPETLYERLGSLPAIEAVTSDLVDRIVVDPRIERHFRQTNRAKFKRWLADFICVETGGPCHYTGRPMRAGHRDMAIDPADFQAVMENVERTLDRFQVPARERAELLALLESQRGDIVTRP